MRLGSLALPVLLSLALLACGDDGGGSSADTAIATDTVTADTTPADTATPTDTTAEDTVVADAGEDTATTADTTEPIDTSPPPALLEDYPLDDDEAYPESVTFDPVGRAFFTGSLALGNVTRIAADGTERELFAGNDEGEWLILGLEADPVRRRLWVCVGEGRELSGSELWLLDLDTGERTWRVDLDTVQPGGVCIDVVLTGDGTAYVADRAFPKVYKAVAETQTITTFADDPALEPGLIGANGIAVDETERFLVVAKFLPPELVRIKLAAPLDVAAVDLLDPPAGSFDGGVDGVTILDGAAYLAIDGQLARATPDESWTYANVAFMDLSLPNGDPVSGVSGITVAEGALYLSQSYVTLFAVGTQPELPFHVFRVDHLGFDDD